MRFHHPHYGNRWLFVLTFFLVPHSAFSRPDSVSQAAQAILQKHCWTCHGSNRISGLDLRQRESLLTGGSRGPAIVPGNPFKSLLYRAVAHLDDPKMPPGPRHYSTKVMTVFSA